MNSQAALLGVKQATLSPESDLWRHAAVRPLADHEAPLAEHQAPRSDGRDFSQVPVHASGLDGGHAEVSCPLSPTRCPFGGACHTCPTRVQAKLAIGRPDDKYEQEADRVADLVMRMPEPRLQRQAEPEEEEEETVQAKPLASQILPLVQRQAEPEEEEEEEEKSKPVQTELANDAQVQRQEEPEEEEEETLQAKPLASHITPLIQRQTEPEEEEEKEEEEPAQAKADSGRTSVVNPAAQAQINALRGGGQPLSAPDRAFFEPRFGYDFSHVQIYTDTRAAESAKAVHARAYTVGQHVVFGTGQYSPTTSTGRGLIAHELTHVVQQRSGLHRQPAQAKSTSSCAQWRQLPPYARSMLRHSFNTRNTAPGTEWIWNFRRSAADFICDPRFVEEGRAFAEVCTALRQVGLLGQVQRVSEIFTKHVQGIRFTPADPAGLQAVLSLNPRFCRDRWIGGEFSSSERKWRQLVPVGSPGLHIIVPTSGLCNAHIDTISPAAKRKPNGRCEYAVGAGLRHIWRDLLGGWRGIGSAIWGGLRFLGSKTWAGLRFLGSKIWSGLRYLGSKAWGGLRSLGRMLTAGKRPLTPEEKTEAEIVFADSLDWDKTRLAESRIMSIGGYARTPFNVAYFPPGSLSLPLGQRMPWIIHELTHVWQTQHGISFVRKLWTALRGKAAYEYGGEKELLRSAAAGKRFTDFNTEQQADICMQFYIAKKAKSDISAYLPFIDQVKGHSRMGDFPLPAGTTRMA
jgi:outer membrane biosynthesis protein TonB